MAVQRRTVDLSNYPNLVVVYLGMQVRTLVGLKTLFGFGPKIAKSGADQPEGLLLHEGFLWSLFPAHAGIRQYWRDFESLERWTRSEPHREWWKTFLRDSGGTGFWHETYFMQGGIEAIYDDLGSPTGLLRFAPALIAKGPMFSARQRAHLAGPASSAPPVSESELAAKE
jgi:fumigallin biosynthesis monooxygenase-like protein